MNLFNCIISCQCDEKQCNEKPCGEKRCDEKHCVGLFYD